MKPRDVDSELAAIRAEVALTAQVVQAISTYLADYEPPEWVNREVDHLRELRERQAELEGEAQP